MGHLVRSRALEGRLAACVGVVASALNLRVDVIDMGRGLGLGESGKVSPL